jgi:ABC-2 type transport system ATP-binding protein
MSAVEVEDLHRTYGAVEALRGVSFTIGAGQIVGLLGPNGAGKSTTLRVLTGWLAPTSGHVRVQGIDVLTDPVAARRHLGYLPEGAPLPAEQTVREVLQLAGRLRGLGRAERARAIERVGEQVGIADTLDTPIHDLSRGFRQRVGLGQALLHEPPLLILDEPTTGLDPNQIAQIRALIREVGATRTVVLSTHVLREVEAVCDRVLILHRGRLIADDSPEAIAAATQGLGVIVALGPSKVQITEQTASAQLGALPGVHAVRTLAPHDGERLRLELHADRDVRAQVFGWAVDHGHVLVALEAEGRHLEDVFRQLTLEPQQEAR